VSASAIYAVFALLFYTAFNAIFARTLHHVTPAVALPIYTSVVVVLGAAVFFLTRSEATVLPDFAEVRLLIFCGVILLAADFCFVSAYHRR
jgi:multidrug transporter EmrE-like cation transporter